MSLQVEKLEHNMVKLTIEIPENELDAAMEKVYRRRKGSISLPGFRKGKAPRAMVERMYGPGIFLEDAVNDLIPEHYAKAAEESELAIVSQPEVVITQLEIGKPLIFTAEVAVKPEVKLGEYMGVEVPKKEPEVLDEEIDAELFRERESNSRTIDVEGRPVEQGDMVNLDFDGYIDGEPFGGGKGENYSLIIGSNIFIPGFEEQLIGVESGGEKDVVVTFPEDYHAENLRGKEAVFKCKVNKIQKKELPEIDDDFAMDVSEFDTLEEYKDDIRRRLTEDKKKDIEREKEEAVLTKIIEGAEMDIPDAMMNAQLDRMVQDFEGRMQSQGLSLEQYFEYTGQDEEKLREDMKSQALRSIQTRLVLENILKAEQIEVTEEDLEEEVQRMADIYRMEPDKIRELLGTYEMDQLKEDLGVQKALKTVVEAAKEVE